MPYFELEKGAKEFPPAHFADLDGLVAVGGDMNTEMLLKAYNNGLFYWHHPMKKIQWWSPDTRMVINLPFTGSQESSIGGDYVIEKSNDTETLLRHLQSVFNVDNEMNHRRFPERMYRIFTEIAEKGLLRLYSITQNGELIGGLFGVAIGKVFFGEYIWAPAQEAIDGVVNKLLSDLSADGFELVDMQKETFRSSSVPYSEMSRLSYVDFCKMNAENNGF